MLFSQDGVNIDPRNVLIHHFPTFRIDGPVFYYMYSLNQNPIVNNTDKGTLMESEFAYIMKKE